MFQLDTPKSGIWWIAVAIGLLGIVSHFTLIPIVSGYAFWFVAAGFVILAITTC
jgi:hypothetical protein